MMISDLNLTKHDLKLFNNMRLGKWRLLMEINQKVGWKKGFHEFTSQCLVMLLMHTFSQWHKIARYNSSNIFIYFAYMYQYSFSYFCWFRFRSVTWHVMTCGEIKREIQYCMESQRVQYSFYAALLRCTIKISMDFNFHKKDLLMPSIY